MRIRRVIISLFMFASPLFGQGQQHDRIVLNTGAAIVQNYTAGGTITAGHLLTVNSSNQAIEATTATVAGVIGIAENSAISGGNVGVAFLGQVPTTVDGACTTGNYITISPTVNGNGHCQSLAPTNQFLGISQSTIGLAGNITVQVNVGNDGANSAASSGANTALSNLASVAINTTLLPGAAGAENLGTAPLPFGDVFIGGSANKALDFNVAALTTNRQVTWPDNAGAVSETNFAETISGVKTYNASDLLLNPGPLTFASGATAARIATFPDNTGTVSELNFAETISANKTFGANNLLLNPGPITLASAGSAARTATLPDNTGTIAELNLGQTWTAAQAFNAAMSTNSQFTSSLSTGTAPFSITSTTPVANLTPQNCDTCNITTSIAPSAAGGIAVGTAAKPFSGFFTGTAATNNFSFSPASTTGARTISIQDFGVNGSITQQFPFTIILTSQYTNATTSFTTVSGGQTFQFSVAANTNYSAECHLYYQSASTGGLNIQFTGPTSPTAVAYGLNDPSAATTFNSAVALAFSTSLGQVVGTAATNFDAVVSFGLVNGANAGTVILQAKSSAAVSNGLIIQPGSFCKIQ